MKAFVDEYGRIVIVAIVIIALLLLGISYALKNQDSIRSIMKKYVINFEDKDLDSSDDTLHHFVLEGVSYTYDKGMTWSQWAASDYNDIGLHEDSYDVLTGINASSLRSDPNKYFVSKNGSVEMANNKITSTVYSLIAYVPGVNKLLNFDPSGGVESPSPITMTISEETIIPLAKPTKEGYTFVGWNTKQDGSGKSYKAGDVYKSAGITPSESATLYAEWQAATAILTYNSNGGTSTPPVVNMKYADEVIITSDEPIKTDYTFNGWNTKADGSGDSYKSGDIFKDASTTPVTTTLYAQWVESSTALTYDANGGANAPDAVIMKYKTATTVSENEPTREGYSFNGWNTKADGSGNDYKAGDTYKRVNTIPTGGTLYAQWIEKTAKLVYNENGGSDGPDSVTMKYSKETIVTGEVPTREGYTLLGWSTTVFHPFDLNKDGSIDSADVDIISSDATSSRAHTGASDDDVNTDINGDGEVNAEDVTALNNIINGITPLPNTYKAGDTFKAANVVPTTSILYAQWSAKTYALELVCYEGKTITETISYTNEYHLPEPTRTGYVFNGWNTKDDGSGSNYAADSLFKPTNAEPIVTTLYGQWVKQTAELAYDLQGGTGTITSAQMKYETETKVTDIQPTKDGFTFAGWNTKPDGSGTSYASGAEFKAANVVPTDTTLYAQWISALCFTANEAGSTISMSVTGTPTLGQNFQYSTDGDTWNTFTPGTTTIALTNKDDEVYFKGNNPNGVSESSLIYYQFAMTGSISASGDIMSLIDDGACTTTEIPNEYCFCGMFSGCTSLTITPELSATTLTSNCYRSMFSGCTSLTTAPELPATTLAKSCYNSMLQGCTSLTTAPELSATTLADYCYSQMFNGCTSLTTAPELPATTLANYCYDYMFQDCTSLTTAPELPVTTLTDYCYSGMFSGCTSLVTASELPAIELATGCYHSMFYKCTSLTTAPELPATTLASHCYYSMFYGCTSLIAAPELPATTLEDHCYELMFYDGTSLTVAPKLPATTLAEDCYSQMFDGCILFTTAPELPATTLAKSCYSGMFKGCKALTTAPELPATTLAKSCYYYMFYGCTSLTAAPELPATTLADKCYSWMFRNCTSLTTVPKLSATTLADDCYYRMFSGCSSLYVSDTSGSGYSKTWRIPASGTFTNTYSQDYMFYKCKGTRSSDNMAGASGQSYTYYTQNEPV